MINQATTESGICSIILHTLLTIISAVLANALFPLTQGFGYTLLAIVLFFALFLFFKNFIPLICEALDHWLSSAGGAVPTANEQVAADAKTSPASGKSGLTGPASASMAVAQDSAIQSASDSVVLRESDSGNKTVTATAAEEAAPAEALRATETAQPDEKQAAAAASTVADDSPADNAESEAHSSNSTGFGTEAEVVVPPAPTVSADNTESDVVTGKPAVPVSNDPQPASAQATGAQAAGLLSQARDGQADDLKKIKGVGPKLEKLCNELGIFHFDQIAAWTQEDVDYIDSRLTFKGRIMRDNWIEQAKQLVKSSTN